MVSGDTVTSQDLHVSPEGLVIFRVPHMPLGLENAFWEMKLTLSATLWDLTAGAGAGVAVGLGLGDCPESPGPLAGCLMVVPAGSSPL